MTLPNFLIIGSSKCGTTALYRFLEQHPDVYMSPNKEPLFFGLTGENLENYKGPGDVAQLKSMLVDKFEDYEALFDGVTTEKAYGEASSLYLYLPKSAERIKHYVPNAKMIAILRDPVGRAYSAFMHLVRDGREPEMDFIKAFRDEPRRIAENWEFLWRYKDMGLYYEQVKRFYDLFDREQIKIYLHDDLVDDPDALIKDAFQFIGVDDSFKPDTTTWLNVSGIPKNRAWHNFLRTSNPLKDLAKLVLPKQVRKRINAKLQEQNLVRVKMPPEAREIMVPEFREDILKLQDLIGRDLSSWLSLTKVKKPKAEAANAG
jgi:hypothetical protein